jgi:two-component system, OmpR family, KDP operon response regulator KdpE
LPPSGFVDLGISNGHDTIFEMRHRLDVPVIALSGRRTELDVVIALDCGADDYIEKPFSG